MRSRGALLYRTSGKTLSCHSYFLALTSSITFAYRLMLYACLLSLLECLSISTSFQECLYFPCYHLLTLVILITLIFVSRCTLRLVILVCYFPFPYRRTSLIV